MSRAVVKERRKRIGAKGVIIWREKKLGGWAGLIGVQRGNCLMSFRMEIVDGSDSGMTMVLA